MGVTLYGRTPGKEHAQRAFGRGFDIGPRGHADAAPDRLGHAGEEATGIVRVDRMERPAFDSR